MERLSATEDEIFLCRSVSEALRQTLITCSLFQRFSFFYNESKYGSSSKSATSQGCCKFPGIELSFNEVNLMYDCVDLGQLGIP